METSLNYKHSFYLWGVIMFSAIVNFFGTCEYGNVHPFLIFIPAELLMFFITFVLCDCSFSKYPWQIVDLKPLRFRTYFLSIPYLIIMIVCVALAQRLQEMFYPMSLSGVYENLNNIGGLKELIVWCLLFFFLVAPIEEIFGRGIIQKGLENSFNKKGVHYLWAILIASIMFSVIHPDAHLWFSNTIVGMFIGLAYHKHENLIIPIIIHGAADSLGMCLAYIATL